VYLDSDHSYEHVCKLLPLLDRKTKPLGVIVGDDWEADPANPNHGESIAVTEFCAETDWKIDSIDPIFGQWRISRG
jgi:hypothetical protein